MKKLIPLFFVCLLNISAFAMDSVSDEVFVDDILIHIVDSPCCSNATFGLSDGFVIDGHFTGVDANAALQITPAVMLTIIKALKQVAASRAVCRGFLRILTPDNIAHAISEKFKQSGLCISESFIKEVQIDLQTNGIGEGLTAFVRELGYKSLHEAIAHLADIMAQRFPQDKR